MKIDDEIIKRYATECMEASRIESVEIFGIREFGNSVIVKCGSGHQQMIMKFGRNWSAATAKQLVEDARHLRHLLIVNSPDCSVSVPEYFRALEDPPAICMDYIDGRDCAELLAEAMRGNWRARIDEMVSIVGKWGAAVATYHRVQSNTIEPEDLQHLHRHLRRLLRLFACSPSYVEKIVNQQKLSRMYDDVGAHNFRCTPDGALVLLDLPTNRTIRPVHSDVADALAWLDDALRDAPFFARAALRKKLRQAFLLGYTHVENEFLSAPNSKWLLRMYLVWAQVNWVRTAVKRRHKFQAVVTTLRLLKDFVWLKIGVNS